LASHRNSRDGSLATGFRGRRCVWLSAALACGSAPSFGQSAADAGVVLRQSERKDAPVPPPPAKALTLPAPAFPSAPGGARVHVEGFRLSGATLVPEPELLAQLSPYVGHDLDMSALRRAALHLSDYYRRRGYFARVLVPPQTVGSGIVTIEVIEGRLASMRIESLPGNRLDPEWARTAIERLQRTGEPLRPDAVQTGLRNLDDVPGVFASGIIRPGASAGEIDLEVRVEEGPLITGAVTLDDYGLAATGARRAVLDLALNDPSGHGDQLTASTYVTDRSDYFHVGYTLPLGHTGLRAGPMLEHIDYRLTGSFAGFGGHADGVGLAAAWPLYRSSAADLFVNGEVQDRHFVNNAAGAVNLSDKTLASLTLRLSGSQIDGLGGGGKVHASLAMTGGRLNLSANAINLAADAAGARTQGGFGKLELSLAREQALPVQQLSLNIAFNGQWSGRNLDSYERLSLGGPTGVRAYPAGQAMGDQGWVINVELRRAINDQIRVFGFYDLGDIDGTRHPYAGSATPNRYHLQGCGLGASYTPSQRLQLRALLARRIGTNPGADANGDDVDGHHELTRAWLQGVFNF
jgi:hemolysin activation/secretion protein